MPKIIELNLPNEDTVRELAVNLAISHVGLNPNASKMDGLEYASAFIDSYREIATELNNYKERRKEALSQKFANRSS